MQFSFSAGWRWGMCLTLTLGSQTFLRVTRRRRQCLITVHKRLDNESPSSRLTIGAVCETLPLEKARHDAEELLYQIRRGIDPKVTRRARAEAEKVAAEQALT